MILKRLGLIGARGYVGAELLQILSQHEGIELACVSSRQLKGERVKDHFAHPSDLVICDLQPEEVKDYADVDVWILALPNGLASQFVEVIEHTNNEALIVDLSADYRFDPSWTYGFSEKNRKALKQTSRISNPGCYATAIQVAVTPLLGHLIGPVHAFGVSGFSGAGTTPSDKNDPERLSDNLLPYKLTGHIHEREVTRHLGHPVHFMPHVASFFRGISVTVSAAIQPELTLPEVVELYTRCWHDEPLIHVKPSEIPEVRSNAGEHHACVGGFSLDPQTGHLVVISTIDNLLKGAATQAVQNLNLALGFPELKGIR